MAEDLSNPTMATLLSNMSEKPSTNKWDVVCSYTVSQLNVFLKNRYDAKKLAKHVVADAELEIDAGITVNYRFDIHLAAPKLSFLAGRSGFCELVMPINEGSSVTASVKDGKPGDPQPIPGGKYFLEIVVPLASMNGDTGAIQDDDGIVTFHDGKAEQHHVIMHFKNDNATSFTINKKGEGGIEELKESAMTIALKNYFRTKVKEIDYALLGVNNEVPGAGVLLLTPKSFVFATQGGGDNGVLSLYIQTRESGNEPGSRHPHFQPGVEAISPVPQGSTASIVLSYSLITQSLIRKRWEAIAGAGSKVEFYADQAEPHGISARLSGNVYLIAKAGASGKISYPGSSRKVFNGLSMNLNDDPLTLKIKNGGSRLIWRKENISSTYEVYESGGGEGSGNYIFEVELTISLDKGPIPLKAGNKEITFADFDVRSSDFKIDARDVPNLHSLYLGRDVPEYYKNLPLEIPKVDTQLGGINFFLTTNLIAPGKAVIDIQSDKGVQTPHDFLIVGNVITAKS